ncbi:MAG: hypothetical protein H6832_16215 [Planctomycetes bacterium]|nr:hypothetical protein [Planctomycetota bacterium]
MSRIVVPRNCTPPVGWSSGAFGASHRFVIEAGDEFVGCGFLNRFG